MKKQVAALFLAAILLLVSVFVVSAALAHPGGNGFQSYTIHPGTAAGGAYQLAGGDGQVSQASNGEYLLTGPQAPSQIGDGCCCLYMPCVKR